MLLSDELSEINDQNNLQDHIVQTRFDQVSSLTLKIRIYKHDKQVYIVSLLYEIT